MRQLTTAAVLWLSVALPLAAQPAITSINPSVGPASGGTIVTIQGSNFTTCPICSPPTPPAVTFGGVPATGIYLQNSGTLTAIVPPHLPGKVDVTVEQYGDGTATLPNAFEYTGTLAEASDRILLPILTPPVRGAFGSEFRTWFEMLNLSNADLQVWGLERQCFVNPPTLICGPFDPFLDPAVIHAGEAIDGSRIVFDGKPGRLLYVSKGRGTDALTNLRVYDVSRNLQSFGTEMPVVHETDFREDRIMLIGIPESPNFRNTLRIYSDRPDAGAVHLTFSDRGPVDLNLTAGANIFEPAYAIFNDFPVRAVVSGDPNDVTGTVEIHLAHSLADPPPPNPARIWAFITVTNNITQEITTITPH